MNNEREIQGGRDIKYCDDWWCHQIDICPLLTQALSEPDLASELVDIANNTSCDMYTTLTDIASNVSKLNGIENGEY